MSPSPSSRCTSARPFAPTSTFWSASSMLTPGRSRIASRYESVATSRSPPSCAASNTPVRIGRASSFDAAGTTCRSASANAAAPTVTPLVGTSGNRGKSFADNVRSVVAKRPASMRASSSSNSTVTVSASRRARMSANRRAGSTTLPSPSPCAGAVTRIVSSRSEPTSSTEPHRGSLASRTTPASAPVRDATARWAVATASASAWRSARNFTGCSSSLERSRWAFPFTSLSLRCCCRACGLWMNSHHPRSGA